MTIYYCFNGLTDYEYVLEEFDIQQAMYLLYGEKISRDAVDYYFDIYKWIIKEFYFEKALIRYQEEYYQVIIDDVKLRHLKQELENESRILEKR